LFEEKKYFSDCDALEWMNFSKEQGEDVEKICEINVQNVIWPCDNVENLAVKYSLPDSLAKIILREFGNEAEEFANAINHPGGVVFRINRNLVKDIQELIRMLCVDMKLEETKYSCDGLRVIHPLKPKIRGSPVYDKGFYEVQDEGSQLIALSANLQSEMKVVDFCCGRGGKALHFASLMNSGILVCHDIDSKALLEAKKRMDRINVCSKDLSIHYVCSDSKEILGGRGSDVGQFKLSASDQFEVLDSESIKKCLSCLADIVLVDAPCSSLGTLRRGPNVRWEIDAENLIEIYSKLQKHILSSAISLVKPGGSLIYSTCTFDREECEDICDWFISQYCSGQSPQFIPVSINDWPSTFSNMTDFKDRNWVKLSPHKHGTDSFFIARFDRII
jgi:16S rRNA (cytosine967-C5)-methyltransferase